MTASRIQTLLLSAIATAVLVTCGAVCASSPPIWQPYRETSIPPPDVAVPAQYLVAEPMQGIPVDAVTDVVTDVLTDVELDQLRGVCCGESSTSVDLHYSPHYDPILGLPRINSQAATTAAAGRLELLPSDLLWHSYWAGAKEPRTSGTLFQELGDDVLLMDVSLGGRTALLRNALRNDQGLWQGWELQLEGAAILRLNLDENWDFDSTDFRFGVPLILARNRIHWKLAYYHLSSHVGDEFLERNPGFTRINFSRDVLVFGASFFPQPAWRWYAETGWAFHDDGGSEPWEFQFGLDYAQPGPTGTRGTPFFALNGHLREEVDFGGNLALQAGWLWRGPTGHVIRTGLHYYNGKSSQFEFFNQFEQQIGFGLWQEY